MNAPSSRKHRVPTPLSPGIANSSVANDNSHKRKRECEEDGEAAGKNCIARPYPSSSPSLSSKLELVSAISRAKLPLSWLDQSAPSTLFPSTTLCKLEQRTKSFIEGDGPTTVVRRMADGELFALELLERDVYVVVKLADWVTDDMISHSAAGLPPSILQQILAAQAMANRLNNSTTRGSHDAKLQLQEPARKEPQMKKGALARLEILPRRETPEVELSQAEPVPGTAKLDAASLSESQKQPESANDLDSQGPPYQDLDPSSSIPAVPSPSVLGPNSPHQATLDAQETFENLHSKYMETLYISKTSVAYFAKGPLARARATFSSDVENSSKLAEFYRDRVLPLKKLDLKFKESLLDCARVHMQDSPLQAKRRKKPKMKLGKNGLYSDEAEFIQQWWQASMPHNMTFSTDATLQQMNHVSRDLRSRETQLQILMVLEAMVLELPPPSNIKAEAAEPDLKDIPTRKKQDLKTHLDLLVDRLCIAHSIAFDNFSDDSQPGKEKSDKLRDFCAEVIIPFYASKLPDQCKVISKKLGGSSETVSKSSRGPLKKSLSTSKVMPGVEIKRTQQPPTRLQRSMTDNFGRSRSPSLPILKREPSERPISRGGIQKNKLLENRQVDLVAVAKQQESKLKKLSAMAEQKKQLDDAISMLRKPNRGMIAKDIAEEVEKRQDARTSGLKSSNKALRPSTGVQVTATPRKKKPGEAQVEVFQSRVGTAPSIVAVPSSTIRPSHVHDSSSQRDVDVQETPSRRASSTSNRPALTSKQHLIAPMGVPLTTTPLKSGKSTLTPPSIVDATPPSSYVVSQEPLGAIANTPFASRLRMTKSQKPVSFTPLKKTDSVVMDVFTRAPELDQDITNEDDIYARLGWMDDGFDL